MGLRPLVAEDRQRYARQLLLSQIGEVGQQRLLAATLRADPDADGGALAVARRYLTRAGMRVSDLRSRTDARAATDATADVLLELPTRAEVERIAGRPELLEAARALAGALSAVRAIKATALLDASPDSPIPAISSEDV